MKFDKQVSSSQILGTVGIETQSLVSFHTKIEGIISGTLYIEYCNNEDLGWVRDPDLDVVFSSPPVESIFHDISKVAGKKVRIAIEFLSGSARLIGVGTQKGI